MEWVKAPRLTAYLKLIFSRPIDIVDAQEEGVVHDVEPAQKVNVSLRIVQGNQHQTS